MARVASTRAGSHVWGHSTSLFGGTSVMRIASRSRRFGGSAVQAALRVRDTRGADRLAGAGPESVPAGRARARPRFGRTRTCSSAFRFVERVPKNVLDQPERFIAQTYSR